MSASSLLVWPIYESKKVGCDSFHLGLCKSWALKEPVQRFGGFVFVFLIAWNLFEQNTYDSNDDEQDQHYSNNTLKTNKFILAETQQHAQWKKNGKQH